MRNTYEELKPELLRDRLGAYLKNVENKKLIVWRTYGKGPTLRGGEKHG